MAWPSGVPMNILPRCFSNRAAWPAGGFGAAAGASGSAAGSSGGRDSSVMTRGVYETSSVASLPASTFISLAHEKKDAPAGSVVLTCGRIFQSVSVGFRGIWMVLVSRARTSVQNSNVFASPTSKTQRPEASSVRGGCPSKRHRMSRTEMVKSLLPSAGRGFPRAWACFCCIFQNSFIFKGLGWNVTVIVMSSCGRTYPSMGETEKTLLNFAGTSKRNLAPRSPKL
mmetsp:Transcript_47811/g.133321  ORF Transcript_47811/g.133321 Transcript_47811/m.133321 type:complete len:226 (-) Transcript_47811:717-1394(-)